MILSAFLLASSFILGCSDNLIYKVNEQKPEIVVYPEMVDFGNLVSGQQSESIEIVIVNAGDGDLNVLSPVLLNENRKFSLYGPDHEYSILAGELSTLTITYTPETFETNEDVIVIESNDEETPYIEIPVIGMGDAPVASISPIEFDYGDITIGCDNEERITITNEGNLPLIIDSVTQMVTQPVDLILEMGTLPDPPWSLEPGLSIDFLLSYIPEDIGHDESQITIVSNDPLTPVIETYQEGDGDVERWYEETHIQEAIAVLDILWVVDDSGSMNRFQSNLSSNIGLFVNSFINSGTDYHMAVITTSDSQIGNLITSLTPNADIMISYEIMVGTHGSGTERGIEMSVEALSNPASAGPGSAFFRSNSSLVVIYVSDEPDFNASAWSTYVNFFSTLKPPGQFIPYGVIGDYPSGCQDANSGLNVQFGAGYWDLIDYFGGNWYSICTTDWGVQLQNLANSLSNRSRFELNESDPIEETIVVSVNGQEVSNWTYDANSNTISFNDGHVPEENETITIEYAVWGC